MTDSPRRCPVVAGCWSIGGEVVAMCGDNIAQNRTGWPPFLSLCLLVRRWRSGERLAMVWTVEASDGAEERRGTGEEVGGILRPGSLSSCFVCSALHHHMKEENEDEAGRMADSRGAALVLFFPGWSDPLHFHSLFVFVLSLYIIRCRYNKDNATN